MVNAVLAPVWNNMHFDSFLRQIENEHFATVFAGSAERGALSLSNGGRTNPVAALKDELRLSGVDKERAVAEVLTKAIRYMHTRPNFFFFFLLKTDY